jgi:dTDP-4-amino-4,6-dideoxygalactose transaminase
MPVPFLDLAAQYRRIQPKIEAAVQDVFASQAFIGGPQVAGLEEEICAYLGTKHAVGVASGTDAILMSLRAAGISPGDEVITSPFTFFATAGAVWNVGAKPVFVDIEPETYNINPDAIEDAITDRTKAIIPIHMFGHYAEVERIAAIAKKHRLRLIEDAAQALGATLSSRHVGTHGDAAALSFFPSKNLGAAGDAGMIATNDQDLADTARRLRNHGDAGGYEHVEVGTNSRLDALQAAVVRVKLTHLADWIEERRKRAVYYGERLSELDGLILPHERPDHAHAYNYYVIRVPGRDEARTLLTNKGIGCTVYYPKPLHLQPCFASLGYTPGEFPLSERACGEVLALPMYAELTQAQQDEVVEALAEHLAPS